MSWSRGRCELRLTGLGEPWRGAGVAVSASVARALQLGTVRAGGDGARGRTRPRPRSPVLLRALHVRDRARSQPEAV